MSTMTTRLARVAIMAVFCCWTANPQVVSGPCYANSGAASARSEGVAELVGDILVYCYVPSPTFLDVTVTLNTNVTNNKDFGNGADITDAVLFAETACYYYPCPPPEFRYGQLASDKVLRWNAVLVLPPGTTGSTTLHIANIRAKVFGVAPYPISSTITATVAVFVSGSPSSLPVSPNQLSVAYSVPGLNPSLLSPASTESFRVRLQEGIPLAFKPLGQPLLTPYVYSNQEDGLLTPGSGVNDGGATQGTRFLIRFVDLPNGVRVLVPHVVQLNSGGGWLEIRRVFNPDTSGAGGCLYLNCPGAPPWGVVGVADTWPGGSSSAVYEVTSSSTWSMDQIDIPITLCHGPGDLASCRSIASSGAIRNLKVRASLAPVSTVVTSDKAAPEPRFWEIGVPLGFPF